MAAASAIRLANEGNEVLLVDLEGDQPALIGMIASPSEDVGFGNWLRDEAGDWGQLESCCEDVAPGLQMLRRGDMDDDASSTHIAETLARLSEARHVVVDGGRDHRGVRMEVDGQSGYAVTVMRACYLALSRAQYTPGPYERTILVEEPGRALRDRDVSAALGSSHIEKVAWDPRVGRSIDAGTIVGNLPAPLRRFDVNFGGMGAPPGLDASSLRSRASEAQVDSRECGAEMTSGGQCTQRVAPGATECRSGHRVRH